MKVYISFGKILVVVLCKNPQMTIKDLQEKAVKRYKTIIKRVNALKIYFILLTCIVCYFTS